MVRIGILISTLLWVMGFEPYSVLVITPYFAVGVYVHYKRNSIDRIDLGMFLFLIFAGFSYMYSGQGIKYYSLYVMSPIFYYYFSNLFYDTRQISNAIKIFLYIFTFYAFSMFFKDTDGNFSYNLSENVYFLTRNYIVYKTEIDGDIMNATNLSLLLLTIPVTLISAREILKINGVISFGIICISVITLFIVSSRTAILAILLVTVYHYVLRKGVKRSRNIMLGTLIVTLSIFALTNSEYTQTFFNRFENFTLAAGTENQFGLHARLVLWASAVDELSNNLFGYGHLYFLHKYEMSTHNEILGQLVALGFLGMFFYLLNIITFWIKIRRIRIDNIHAKTLRSLGINLTIIYVVVGITENVAIANTFWLLYLFFVYGLCVNSIKIVRWK